MKDEATGESLLSVDVIVGIVFESSDHFQHALTTDGRKNWDWAISFVLDARLAYNTTRREGSFVFRSRCRLLHVFAKAERSAGRRNPAM